MSACLSLSRQVEELTLIWYSLLPGEHLTFLDTSPDLGLRDLTLGSSSVDNKADAGFGPSEAEKWQRFVLSDPSLDFPPNDMSLSPARFQLTVEGSKASFKIDCQGYNGEYRSINDCITLSGDDLSRAEQRWWRERILEGLDEIGAEERSEYPLYQLLTSHLLPLLHPTPDEEESQIAESQGPSQPRSENIYHVLFTSHHLVSPTKRRNLQRWSSEYHLDGFAKLGYPGIIYAQGSKDDVEDFAENVKAMQWKALKARFLEPLENLSEGSTSSSRELLSGWNEFEKVGQVVEVMRKMGRGRYVTEMGIGGGNE